MYSNLYTNDTVELKTTSGLEKPLSNNPDAEAIKSIPESVKSAVEVIIIDDDAQYLEEMSELLETEGYCCHKSTSTSGALRILSENKNIGIILVDYLMPKLSGLDFIRFIKAGIGKQMNYEYVLVTGHAKKDIAINAIRLGVEDIIEKPIDSSYVISIMGRINNKHALKRNEDRYIQELEADVSLNKNAIKTLKDQVEVAYADAIDCIAEVSDYNDSDTGRHLQRMSTYARIVAKEYGCTEEEQRLIELAAPLHDIGKIGIPDNILMKPGKLSPEETEIVRSHPDIARSLFSRAKNPVMKCVAEIAGGHHERWDGTGYPRGLKGEEIPLEARIVSICSVYDALRSPRSYRQGFTHEHAVKIMLNVDKALPVGHFDPRIRTIFKNNHQVFDSIYTMSIQGFNIKNYDFVNDEDLKQAS